MSSSSWADRAESLERMAQQDQSDTLKTQLIEGQAQEAECVDWSDDDDGAKAPASFVDSELGEEKDDKSLCVALCTVALAIPALVGSWCWPILVGAMFAVAASNVNGGLVAFFHGVQVAVMMALMTNILQFAWWKLKKKKGTHWQRKGPLWILLLASFMVLTQPVCMLVVGSWEDMPNFFFDGGDTGAPCSANSDCGSGECDPASGIYAGPAANQTDIDLMLQAFWTGTGCSKASWEGNGVLANAASSFATAAVTNADGTIKDSTDVAATFLQFCKTTDSPMYYACGQTDGTKCTNALENGSKLANIAGNGGTNACQCDIVNPGGTCGCTCAMDSNALVPNTHIGLFIQIFCTYGGFLLMFTGVFQATNLHVKIMKKFRALRGRF